MSAEIEQLLGSDATDLLEHTCSTFPKESLHLPGSDFISRIYAQTDRPITVLRSLAQVFDHGRLAGTGYLSILPVDQGVEHSAGASFGPNPGALATRMFPWQRIMPWARRVRCQWRWRTPQKLLQSRVQSPRSKVE